ncbi:MAG: hypothetical protein ACJAZO_004903 [Myxococcota bacterium]|jgi:hypothetical protein
MTKFEHVEPGNMVNETRLGGRLGVSCKQDGVEYGNYDGGVVMVACQWAVGVESRSDADPYSAGMGQLEKVLNTGCICNPEFPNRQVIHNGS